MPPYSNWNRAHGTPWRRGRGRQVYDNSWITVTEFAATAPTGRPSLYGLVEFKNRALAASGSFVTKGGGSTRNVETVPLGAKLEGRDAQPDGADVQFDWTVNGVPFRYSVRRDPNC